MVHAEGVVSVLPDGRFVPGDEVIVLEGPLIRYRGEIVSRAAMLFGDEPVWRVRFPGVARLSELRESYLAPVPRESDDDVMSPLRRTVSG